MVGVIPLREEIMRLQLCAFLGSALLVLEVGTRIASAAETMKPFRIEVVERGSGWPVCLVELETVHHLKFVTDNAGVVAIDAPDLMERETFFHVHGNGYEYPADGFGYHGVRLTPKPGERARIEVERKIIAKRIGRITGAGLFAESQRLGEHLDWEESGVFGQDSVQNAVHNGRMFWAWGDTNLSRYPLGLFDMASATTEVHPLESCEPPLKLRLDYFRNDQGQPRAVAKMEGKGPTWLGGYVSLPDKHGKQHLVASYVKIRNHLEAYESGLCVWSDETENFEPLKKLWTKSDSEPRQPPMPDGHPAVFKEDGKEWLLFGNPLPNLRCPATFEAWQDPNLWERLKPQEHLESAAGGAKVKPHSGSIAWNEYRKRWVTVFMEHFGKPSAFGELWYAEAQSPLGPWGPAAKVLTHENYTFYNPRLHPEFTPAESPILLFEGTYTDQFTNKKAVATPRYDYNQILYRLDLDDEKLKAAMP
jgi:hypothetical protein